MASGKRSGPLRNEARRVSFIMIAALLVLSMAIFLMVRKRWDPKRPPMITSVAVLPFRPIVESQRDDTLELGMTNAVIARLSSLEGITVRPLAAVRQYVRTEADAIMAGRTLGVDAVLEGNILHTPDRIRVNARLLRVGDGTPLWQGQFDRPQSQMFAVRDSISEQAGAALMMNNAAAREDRGDP